MGRPPLYTKDTEDKVIDLIADGKSLRDIAAMKGMPAIQTLRYWQQTRPDFLSRYARAKEECADMFAEELVSLADQLAAPDTTHEQVQAMRTRIDTRKWIAAKLKPTRYGDRVTHSGDAENPLQVDVSLSPKQELLEYLASRSKAIGGEGDGVIDGEVVYPTSHTTQKPETKTQPVEKTAQFSSRRSRNATGSLGDKSKDDG